MALWVLLCIIGGVAIGYPLGMYCAMRWLPRILAKLSTPQLADLAEKTARYRPQSDDFGMTLGDRIARQQEEHKQAVVQSLAREQQRYQAQRGAK